MFHKGLNKEVLIEASKELIEENGIAALYQLIMKMPMERCEPPQP